MIHDVHCHFFSPFFFAALARQKGEPDPQAAVARLTELLGWENPGSPEALADRWVAELDANGVGRAALIASVPGDEGSVAAAVRRHPRRFVGFFMVDATEEGSVERVERALEGRELRSVCLFPALHHYSLYSEAAMKVFEAAARRRAAVFVHCGALSMGVRKKLGLPSRFDLHLGNPLDLHLAASTFPELPLIVPHFGAGLFREALMLADLCPNVHLDTSSSNRWIRYEPALTLPAVFRQALEVAGPDRLLFGTDSSFFPRGWQKAVWREQAAALEELGVEPEVREQIFFRNFDRLFPEA